MYDSHYRITLLLFFAVAIKSNISEEEVRRNHLSTLTTAQFADLCAKVKEFDSLAGLDPNAKIYGACRSRLYHINGKIEQVVLRKCPTEPTTYLHMGKSNARVKISKIDELFWRFPFRLEVVKTVGKYIHKEADGHLLIGLIKY